VSTTYLTAAQVAAQLGEDVDNIRRRCARGQIPAKKLGHEWRITQADVDAFMRPDNAAVKSPRDRMSARQRRRAS